MHLARAVLLSSPLLFAAACVSTAMAQDAQPAATMPALSPELLMSLGPYGFISMIAFSLGKGLRLTINVKLDDADRKLVERGVEALEKKS